MLEAKHQRHIKAKCVASFTGKIISMWLGLGDIGRLMTRALYRLLQSRASWYDILCLDEECMREIGFWLDNIRAYNRQSLWHSSSAVRIVFSDASDIGYSGYIVEHSCYAANGLWEDFVKTKSSTWRELVAVKRVLTDIAGRLVGQRVCWHTDNQNAARMLSIGSKKEESRS